MTTNDIDLIKAAGRVLADRGCTASVGKIDILSIGGRHVLWPWAAEEAHDLSIQVLDGSLEDAMAAAPAAQVFNHTAGPWHVRAAPNGQVYILCPNYGEIACMGSENQLADDSSAAANARLIVAAPDLLAHLKRLVRAIDRMPANAADGLADEAREFVAQVQA